MTFLGNTMAGLCISISFLGLHFSDVLSARMMMPFGKAVFSSKSANPYLEIFRLLFRIE